MPQDTAPGAAINLLPEEQIQQEPIPKFLRWVLTAGRYIIIFSEALVLIVFMARFKLDTEIVDLKKEITSKAQVLEQAQGFEKEFLDTQSRFQRVGSLVESLKPRASIFSALETTIPQQITLERFTQKGGDVEIIGTANDYSAVSRWVALLRKEGRWSQVKLESIQHDDTQEGENVLSFSILAKSEVSLPAPTSKPAPPEGELP